MALTALCATMLMTGCGGDDENDDDSGSEKETQADCQAAVEITGAVKASWSGEGYVIKGGQAGAFYKSEDGKVSVMLYPEQGDFPANAVVSAKKGTFTTQSEDGVDIPDDGSGAQVDADATGVKPGQELHLVAEFEC